MDGSQVFEYVFNAYSIVSNVLHIGNVAPTLAFIYLAFLFAYATGWLKLRQPNLNMTHSPVTLFNIFIYVTLRLSGSTYAQTTAAGGADGLASLSSTPSVTAAPSSVDINGTPTSFREIFTYVFRVISIIQPSNRAVGHVFRILLKCYRILRIQCGSLDKVALTLMLRPECPRQPILVQT